MWYSSKSYKCNKNIIYLKRLFCQRNKNLTLNLTDVIIDKNYICKIWNMKGFYKNGKGSCCNIWWKWGRSEINGLKKSVLWLFRSDWNRLNPGGIFQRSMIKNRIVVIEKSTNKNRTFVLFSCVNLYTFKNLFDIIGTVTRTNSKNRKLKYIKICSSSHG